MQKTKKWSQEVTRHSDALDLERDVFSWKDPKRIAESLKHSAEESNRKRARSPYQSAMSMLSFYINRAGTGLGTDQKHVLEEAKTELRKQFGRA